MSSYPELTFEPPFWFSGMTNPKLMIFVNCPYIHSFTPTISSSSVHLDGHQTFHSPHYLSIFLDLTNSPPHSFSILFTSSTTSFSKSFSLHPRSPIPATFTSSDVLYLFIPDRFSHGRNTISPVSPLSYPYSTDRSNPDIRHGGDLQGVRDHLDYFVDLGVTCLWPTPIFENDINEGSYHGYSISNFYKVDPRFGTNESFFDFVADAQSRGLKVIIDLVFNHCAGTHQWALDPPTEDWFHFPGCHLKSIFDVTAASHAYGSEYDRSKLQDREFTIEMPDLNQRNPIVASYLIQMSIWWVETAHLNGIRMDTFAFCDLEMMRNWGLAVEAEFPGLTVVGEVWKASSPAGAWFQRGNLLNKSEPSLPSVMDFPLASSIQRFFKDKAGLFEMYKHFAIDFLYPNINLVLRFAENHDTHRLLESENDIILFKKAMLMLLTVPGIPQLYYGTELMMAGKMVPTDGNVRKDFPGGWREDLKNGFVKEGRGEIQHEAFAFLLK
jgi:glycosidase